MEKEIDDVVARFRQRRADRLLMDAYRKRRDERIKGYNLDGDWEENKHPRDKGGKFAKKGTGGGGGSSEETTESKPEKATEKGLTTLQKSSKIQTKGEKSPDMLEDERKAKEWIGKVNGIKSNTYKPFVKEPINLDKVAKEAGVNMTDARTASYPCNEFVNHMAKIEPKITKDVVDVVSKLGGSMYGLPFRMKQPTSLARKVLQDCPEHATEEEIRRELGKIKDGCRYTAIYDDDNFTENYNKTKEALEKMGYKEVRCKNYWKQYLDGKSIQKAVQCVYQDKDGNFFELQFHTNDSQGVKEVNHPLYEEERQTGTEANKRAELRNRMKNIGMLISDPEGVVNIKEHDET